MEVAFEDGLIRFLDYRYPPASVFPDGELRASDIRDADPTSPPPELRLTSGETLFVSAVYREELWAFCRENGVRTCRRPDVWGAVLQPFVDTAFTKDDDARANNLLDGAGIAPNEVAEIRDRIGPAMVAYNLRSGLWDWTHLGLADLLDTYLGRLAGSEFRLSQAEFAATYSWAMDLADRPAKNSTPLA